MKALEKVKELAKDERGVLYIFQMLIAIGIAIAVIFVVFGVIIPQIGSQSESVMNLPHNSTWYYIQTRRVV